jgi:membrane-bound serine protease (ClpP class)
MKRNALKGCRSGRLACIVTLIVACASLWSVAARADGVVIRLELEGALGVATAEYITSGIEDAVARNARLVIIRMDTPGGLVEPMRDIVRTILGSEIPVVTYVSPGGARADSAGTYILLASHVAAMAPTTHLGAATPVSLGGGDRPDPPTPLKRQPSGDDEQGADDKKENPAEPAQSMTTSRAGTTSRSGGSCARACPKTPRRALRPGRRSR